MKTIIEWLRTLPEPYRSLALSQPEKIRFSHYPYSTECESLASAVDCAFSWGSTAQGRDYWIKVQQRAERGDFDKQYIDCTIPEEKEET